MNKFITERGFNGIQFKDRYNNECSIQQSSLATENAIWFGINNANPLVMSANAPKYGIIPNGSGTGWVSFPIPKDVLLHTRMHLTQEQVKELLPILQKFAETGEL